MKANTTKRAGFCRLAVRLVVLLSLAPITAGIIAGPARADNGDWHGHDGHDSNQNERQRQEREWHDHKWQEHSRVVYPTPYYGYAPPPVVYAPPPVVYAPPPGPPVLNFVFPLNIH